MSIGLNQDPENYYESQLCVPDDNLDDLDFFPNFMDDLIQLTDEPVLMPAPLAPRRDSFHRNRVVLHKPEPLVSQPSFKRNRKGLKQETSEGDDMLDLPYEQEIEVPAKRRGRRRALVERRRCSHCDAEKTPQWREGPNGPNSLCNACGVRYKSGRLVPEYRPAASPSFDRRKHSNFHKKIISKAWQDDIDDGEVLNG